MFYGFDKRVFAVCLERKKILDNTYGPGVRNFGPADNFLSKLNSGPFRVYTFLNTMLKKIKILYRRWMVVGKRIALFQTKVVFIITYFIFIIPFGLFVKLFYKFPKPGWHKPDTSGDTLDEARRQF